MESNRLSSEAFMAPEPNWIIVLDRSSRQNCSHMSTVLSYMEAFIHVTSEHLASIISLHQAMYPANV